LTDKEKGPGVGSIQSCAGEDPGEKKGGSGVGQKLQKKADCTRGEIKEGPTGERRMVNAVASQKAKLGPAALKLEGKDWRRLSRERGGPWGKRSGLVGRSIEGRRLMKRGEEAAFV